MDSDALFWDTLSIERSVKSGLLGSFFCGLADRA
jgi:hypothetical protein